VILIPVKFEFYI